jgi:ribosomal protein S18 acetylase RimI-like enzyme
MTTRVVIRHATPADRPQLRRAIVELQEYERQQHSTRLPGEQIADAYLDWMQREARADGAVLLAETGGSFAGFVAGWIEQVDCLGETPDSNRFGYISDIFVRPAFRGKRIAARLLDASERHLRQFGIARLRINVLADNASARASYEHAGFAAYEIVYEKLIDGRNDEAPTGIPGIA